MRKLHDALGRHLYYLRLSVTDRCNFKCTYCLPNGCPKSEADAAPSPLSGPEIGRLVRAFAELGFWKVRLTGGEPTLRQDIESLIRTIAQTPGIRKVALTTNGYRLIQMAPTLRAAGLTTLNVSLDSLETDRFTRISGTPVLSRVLSGIEAAVAAGIPAVKINAVLLKDMPESELDAFFEWTRTRPIDVRFIELMRTEENSAYFRAFALPAQAVRAKLEARGWEPLPREEHDGPAIYHGHPEHQGRIGLIAPYGAGFCDCCNRLRINSAGDLRLCLFNERQVPLRPLLQRDEQRKELMSLIEASVTEKPESHHLHECNSGNTRNLAQIGG